MYRDSKMLLLRRQRRRSGVPSNAITERRRRERERYPLSLPCSFPSLRRTRARATAQDEAWNRGRGDTFFRVSLSRLAARVHDYDAPVPYNHPSRGSSVDSDTRSARAIHPPFLLRGSYAAVGALARAAPRDHGRYAVVDPRAAAAAARNRVNASPVVLLIVHLGRRPRRRETAGLSSSLRRGSVHPRFARIRGASRARSSRANVQRSLVRARQVRRRASSLWLLKRPSARRGPGIVSVDRNVRSKCRCSCVLQFTS